MIKKNMTKTFILVLLDFDKMFEVKCDASNVGIGIAFSQNGKPIAVFSEKLNKAKRKYSTNDKNFYTLVHVVN